MLAVDAPQKCAIEAEQGARALRSHAVSERLQRDGGGGQLASVPVWDKVSKECVTMRLRLSVGRFGIKRWAFWPRFALTAAS